MYWSKIRKFCSGKIRQFGKFTWKISGKIINAVANLFIIRDSSNIFKVEFAQKPTTLLVIITIVGIVMLQAYAPFFSKASEQTSIEKSTTADWELGTTNNINTASDEMKLMPNPRTAWYSTGGTWNYRKKIVIDHT
ncbi:hypothetical protein COT77_03460, partial [Candidatus Berkelbacteria bacterium CG10_big_fil_rev_8_21_14_0_10_41_12]